MKKILKCIAILMMANHGIIQAQLNGVPPLRPKDRLTDEKQRFLKQQNTDEVWFYEHSNYKGKKYILQRGRYTLANLGMSANDFFSSALVPSHLVVIVYMDDNEKGNWLMLKPDDANYGHNADFTNINAYRYWQTPSGDPLSGVANINDKISSISICDPSKDLITLFADCDYKGTQVQITALPNYNHNTMSFYTLNEYFPAYCHNVSKYFFEKKASSIQFYGMVESVYLYKNGAGGAEENNSIPCLTAVQITLRNSKKGNQSLGNFNDQLNEIGIKLKPGSVKIIQ
jgi:hypothetical protein